jgi:hypothetical protein
MVRPKAKAVEYLSNTERDVLDEQKKDFETQLKDIKEFGAGTPAAQMDASAIQKQIKRIDKVIEEREAPKVSGSRKDELYKECEKIREILVQGMPTKYEMDHPAKCPGAVRKHLNWLRKNTTLIERHRTIQRLINPDEPMSVEDLRKEK